MQISSINIENINNSDLLQKRRSSSLFLIEGDFSGYFYSPFLSSKLNIMNQNIFSRNFNDSNLLHVMIKLIFNNFFLLFNLIFLLRFEKRVHHKKVEIEAGNKTTTFKFYFYHIVGILKKVHCYVYQQSERASRRNTFFHFNSQSCKSFSSVESRRGGC